MNYVQKHMTDALVGLHCFVRLPLSDVVEKGTITSVKSDGRSEHIRWLRDGDTEDDYTIPALVYLSQPVQVQYHDAFGDCTIWEESLMMYR